LDQNRHDPPYAAKARLSILRQVLSEYQDISPFAVAWVCFQLGVLWGELVSESQSGRAAYWYRKAIEYLPRYVKARNHLSEIYLRSGNVSDAESVLASVVSSGDPEVIWRLADVMVAAGRFKNSEELMQAAQTGFEVLLGKHLLAFADHGAEFYSTGGNDPGRAFELARVNLASWDPLFSTLCRMLCSKCGNCQSAIRPPFLMGTNR
jgi:hypothetical protein